jgi:hypothetical protein
MLRRFSVAGVVFACLLLATPGLPAQERFSFFVASTPDSVEGMLRLADLRDDDVVVDLGSGDGLIPRTAAKMNGKLRGWGVDVDEKLVERANNLARAEGLADRVQFYHRNAFDADLSDATVITMWLFPELMQLLRPVILERARPGTRVLTSMWNLGTWQPDEVGSHGTTIYKWIVPAKVEGAWQWDIPLAGRTVRYSAVIEQHFQMIEGVARAGDRREVLKDAKLQGEDVAFALEITVDGLGLTTHRFTGKVQGNRITGTVDVEPTSGAILSLPWQAWKVSQSDYFAHTGLDLFKQPSAATP